MTIPELKALIRRTLKASILYRNFRLDMFASRVAGRDITNILTQPTDLFDAINDNKETDDYLMTMLER